MQGSIPQPTTTTEHGGAHDEVASSTTGALDAAGAARLARRRRSDRAIGILLAALGVLGFSLRPILIKLAYAIVPDPITMIALRMAFSLPFFLAVAAWYARRSMPPARGGAPTGGELAIGANAPLRLREFAVICLLGFLGYYLASFLDFIGLQYISAGLGRLLLFLYPTIVVVLSAIFLRKPVAARDVIALAFAYAGTALVLSGSLSSPQRNAHLLLGAACAFGGAIVYAVYLVAGSRVIARVGSMRYTAFAMTFASVCCILQFLIARPLSALALPASIYVISITMAIVSTVLPVFMTSEALRRIGANDVAMLGALGPVSTILLGWLGLDERLGALQVGGVALVLAGVVTVSLKRSG